MIGDDIYNAVDKSVEVDLSRRSQFGSSVITLASRVEDEPARLLRSDSGLRSRLVSLTSGRPRAGGEVRCRVMRPPASARALRGWLPAITGYNGDNGLIRHIMVRECDPGVGTRDTGECGDQGQCGRLLVIWALGSLGEQMPGSAGIEMRGGHIMLEVTYNPGTGWLYDSSGIELFYSTEKNFKKVKLRVTSYFPPTQILFSM